jgi:hypothetical protein
MFTSFTDQRIPHAKRVWGTGPVVPNAGPRIAYCFEFIYSPSLKAAALVLLLVDDERASAFFRFTTFASAVG